ncbi:restriction endonuclease subunit S [Escherichia ruysiae]|uniref:restriction endonuclease subunit S n=1 Tax=Escherichia ruysiae TaxID=2608867 RepID=UPI0015838A1A|nr:restriction endonuclease subunit S [Escherichia ruysiae]MBY7191737.1 restriction endonuclease subunit S [Escherichia ruysiae]MBY7277741.1 restriction endonuclease subunit S [Escherichia ruysiae]
MGSKWKICELGEFIELKRGYDLPKNSRIKGTVPIISSSGLTDYHNEAMVKGPGVITGRYGTIGEVFYIEDDFWPLNTTLYVIDFKGNEPLFVYYLLHTLSYSDYTDKAAVPGINRNHLHKAKIRVPVHPDTQKKIATQLYKLETRINLNNKLNQTLEQMSQTIFKSWFVDFDPVIDNALDAGKPIPEALQSRAELRQKVRNSTDFKPLPAEIRSLFPNEFEETELGWVPKGWESETFDSFCDLIQSGGTPSRKETSFWDGGTIKWLSSGEVKGKIVLDTKEKITDIGLLNSSSKLWEKYTTVVAMYGATAGEVCIIGDKMAANQACCGLYSKKFPFFVYNFVCNKANELASKATGSAQQNLNKLIISTTKFICPSNDIITIFENNVTPLFMKWFSHSSENNTLTALRDTLLPKLISGELSLEDLPDLTTDTEAA